MELRANIFCGACIKVLLSQIVPFSHLVEDMGGTHGAKPLMKKNYQILGVKISESDQKRGRSLDMKSESKKHANHTSQSPVRSVHSSSDENKYRDSSTENCQNEKGRTEQIEQPSYGTLNKVNDKNEESKEEGPRVIEQRDDLQNHGTNKEESTELEDMRKREDCKLTLEFQMNCSQSPATKNRQN